MLDKFTKAEEHKKVFFNQRAERIRYSAEVARLKEEDKEEMIKRIKR